MSLFLYIFTLDDIVCTALCKALCLLLCKKLKIPLKAKPTKLKIPLIAKPTKPEIIVLKIPLLLYLSSEYFDKIKPTSFFNI